MAAADAGDSTLSVVDGSPAIVSWHDAHALTDSWTSVSDLDARPRIIVSCGFLLDDVKPGHHVLVQSLDKGEGHIDGALAIPDSMVVSVTRLITWQQ